MVAADKSSTLVQGQQIERPRQRQRSIYNSRTLGCLRLRLLQCCFEVVRRVPSLAPRTRNGARSHRVPPIRAQGRCRSRDCSVSTCSGVCVFSVLQVLCALTRCEFLHANLAFARIFSSEGHMLCSVHFPFLSHPARPLCAGAVCCSCACRGAQPSLGWREGRG